MPTVVAYRGEPIWLRLLGVGEAGVDLLGNGERGDPEWVWQCALDDLVG